MRLSNWVVGLGALGMSGIAQAGIWGEWAVAGSSCNEQNVDVMENGNALAVLFNDFGIRMPQGETGDGMQVVKTCNVRVAVTPPQGKYLATFKQLLMGGMVKSKKATTRLEVRYRVGGANRQADPIVWPSNMEIRPEDERSLFTQSYDEPLGPGACSREKVNYVLMMTLRGNRMPGAFVVGGLDSVDLQLDQNLNLVAQWKSCPLPNNERIVTALYRIHLNRYPEPAGMQFWLHKMNQGLTLPQIIAGIKQSPEYQNGPKRVHKEAIEDMYQDLLDRDGDYNGVQYFLDRVANGTWSIVDAENAIKSSTEYKQKHP